MKTKLLFLTYSFQCEKIFIYNVHIFVPTFSAYSDVCNSKSGCLQSERWNIHLCMSSKRIINKNGHYVCVFVLLPPRVGRRGNSSTLAVSLIWLMNVKGEGLSVVTLQQMNMHTSFWMYCILSVVESHNIICMDRWLFASASMFISFADRQNKDLCSVFVWNAHEDCSMYTFAYIYTCIHIHQPDVTAKFSRSAQTRIFTLSAWLFAEFEDKNDYFLITHTTTTSLFHMQCSTSVVCPPCI